MLRDVQTATREARREQHSPVAFFDGDVGDLRRPVHIELRLAVRERNVDRIGFEVVDVVTWAHVSLGPERVLLEIWITWQRRRVALAEINEDQFEVFLRRTTANANLFGEGFLFGGLLDALPGAIVFPTVKAAANAIVLDPADRKLGLAVRTTKIDDVRFAAFAAVEGEFFAQDFDRLGPTGLQIFGATNRMPEFPHVPACQRAGARVIEIHEIDHECSLPITSKRILTST